MVTAILIIAVGVAFRVAVLLHHARLIKPRG